MVEPTGQKYDFFVSYARADDDQGWVSGFIDALREEQPSLNPFFDQETIPGGKEWQGKLHEGIGQSALFIAFISPRYLASEWCRKEWHLWLEQEIALHILTDGIRPIYLAPVPGFDAKASEDEIARQVAELCNVKDVHAIASFIGMVGKRQLISDFVKPFEAEGKQALQTADLRKILEKLAREATQQYERIRIADHAPNTVPPYNSKFTGRIKELLELREWLAKDNRTGVIYGIHGLGGIGKTELALAYAQAFASRYPAGRFLIRCENKSSLRDVILGQSDFVSYFDARIPDEAKKQPQTYFDALRAQISERIQTVGPMLLVLDNVTEPALVSRQVTQALTSLGPNLQLLATTRLGPPPADKGHWLSLDRLPERDALALLEKHRPFADEAEHLAAVKIVRQLGGFTLAIELVAAWLAAHEGASYVRTAESLSFERLEKIGKEEDIELARHDERRLSAVLEPVLESLERDERRTMEYAAFLPPDSIALPWLRELIVRDFPEAGEVQDDLERWPEIVARLRNLSLLGSVDGGDERLVRLHRLVQELVKQDLGTTCAEIEDTVKNFVVERSNALREETHWQQARWELEPLEATARLWAATNRPLASWLLTAAGLRLQDNAEWSRAETLARMAFDLDEKALGPNHDDVAVDLGNLASLFYSTGRLGEAERLMRHALELGENSHGLNHPLTAIRLGNLAQVLIHTNRFAEAEYLTRRALEIEEKCFGTNHPSVALRLNNLAMLMIDMERLPEAEKLMERALEIDQAYFGANHTTIANRLSNLAQVLQEQNELVKAEPLMRRALQIYESNYGPHHPDVATNLNNLAWLLYCKKQVNEAEPLMRRALAIDEASFGPDHVRVATDLNNLALLLGSTDRIGEAEMLMRRQLAIFVKFARGTGHPHPHLQAAAKNYFSLLRKMGSQEGTSALAVALVAPEAFEEPPLRADAIALAYSQIEEARRDGRTEVARILEEIVVQVTNEE